MAAATVNAAEYFTDVERSWITPVFHELIENRRTRNAFPYAFAQKFTIPATSVDDASDIVRLFKAPAGAYIWAWRSTPSDMDSGANLVYDIVATDDSDVVKLQMVTGSTKAQAASGSDALLDAARGRYIGNYWVAVKVTTGAAGGALAGTLKCAWQLSIGVVNRSRRGIFLSDAEV